MKKTFFFQLLSGISIVAFFATLLSYSYVSYTTKNFFINQQVEHLKKEASLIESYAVMQFKDPQFNGLNHYKERPTRLSLIDLEGNVIFDSDTNSNEMENHNSRPEVMMALKGEVGHSLRFSKTIGQEMLYLAYPIIDNEKIIGVTRLAVYATHLSDVMKAYFMQTFWGLILIFVLSVLFATIYAKKYSRTIMELKEASNKFQMGDYYQTFMSRENDPIEIRQLAVSLNKMAKYLRGRILKIKKQKSELDTIFSSMEEGILSLDQQGKIFHYNKKFLKMFNLHDAGQLKGKSLLEVLQEPSILEIFQLDLIEKVNVEKIYADRKGRFFNIKGGPLVESTGEKLGFLAVFQDVTAKKNLENHRKEFVANVGHELRTPLTAIRGHAEALCEDNSIEPKLQKKFLDVILKQTNRLAAIVDDLFKLAQIERDQESKEIQLEPIVVCDVLDEAISNCLPRAQQKKIEIQKVVNNVEIKAYGHANLLEQCFVNLLDNAIKYSPENSKVNLNVEVKDEWVIVSFIDEGIGIPAEHLDRVFERFYSVDKARSRELGGSGLGLSIVKHIAEALGGKVDALSRVGLGSTFKLYLKKS